MLPSVSALAYAPEPEWRLNHERSVQGNSVTADWDKRASAIERASACQRRR